MCIFCDVCCERIKLCVPTYISFAKLNIVRYDRVCTILILVLNHPK